MQKGFVFLLIIWNSSPFTSGNATMHLLFSLGCQAVIPCQHYRSDSNSFKWFYKKDEHSRLSMIYFQDKRGIEQYWLLFRSRMKVPNNGSLVINHFTEEDQGLYWCENSFQDNRWNKLPTISVKKEIQREIRQTFYVIEGISFTYACPGDFINLKWTFEASDTTALGNSEQGRGPEPDFGTYNNSMRIVKVKRADAGKYTCWKSECDGHKQKLLTINLCVLTVHNSEVSSVSCAVMCDMEFSHIKANGTINVETGTRTISVPVDPNGSLNCSAKQMFYGPVNSTHGPSHAFNNSTDLPTEPEYLMAVIYGTSAVLASLILMSLLICYRQKLLAAWPVHFCCCGLNGMVEEETSVVYSSIVLRRPAQTTNNHMSSRDSRCVYSQIKVKAKSPELSLSINATV